MAVRLLTNVLAKTRSTLEALKQQEELLKSQEQVGVIKTAVINDGKSTKDRKGRLLKPC